MAKQGKTLPARRRRGSDDSVVIRSAESLGRMIGSLQRQLDGATKALKLGSVDALLDGRKTSAGDDNTPDKATPPPEARKPKPPKASARAAAAPRRPPRGDGEPPKKPARSRRSAAVRKAARHA